MGKQQHRQVAGKPNGSSCWHRWLVWKMSRAMLAAAVMMTSWPTSRGGSNGAALQVTKVLYKASGG